MVASLRVKRRTRVAAYALCLHAGQVLLARFVAGDSPEWTLPGGGLHHGEDPADAACRELTEETGYTGRIERLLGVNSRVFRFPRGPLLIDEMHAVRIFYFVTITGGELRNEVGGSTDEAAWFPLNHVAELKRGDLIDTALTMHGGPTSA